MPKEAAATLDPHPGNRPLHHIHRRRRGATDMNKDREISDLWIQDFKSKVRKGQVLYWMHEVTGRMRAIVLKFFKTPQDLTNRELEILKWYIDQWIDAMPHRPPQWREQLARCKNGQDLKEYTWILTRDYAIDPF